MGSETLLAALRGEGEKRAEAIRREAAAEIACLKNEAAVGSARLREEFQQRQTQAIAAVEAAILAEAGRAARHVRLAAADKLGERLHALASGLLPRLRGDDYPGMFGRLAAELPAVEWEAVRVNPADAELAGRLFPTARIVPDATISGGLEASEREGRVRVDNTLEKRLERGWPDLLPLFIAEVERIEATDGTPEPAGV